MPVAVPLTTVCPSDAVLWSEAIEKPKSSLMSDPLTDVTAMAVLLVGVVMLMVNDSSRSTAPSPCTSTVTGIDVSLRPKVMRPLGKPPFRPKVSWLAPSIRLKSLNLVMLDCSDHSTTVPLRRKPVLSRLILKTTGVLLPVAPSFKFKMPDGRADVRVTRSSSFRMVVVAEEAASR